MTIYDDSVPVLSGDDRLAERGLLMKADLAVLQRRLQRAITRRSWWMGFGSGIGSGLALAALAGLAALHGYTHRSAHESLRVESPGPTMTPTMTRLERCALQPASVNRQPATNAPAAVTSLIVKATESTRPAPTELTPRMSFEGSRLRTQLRIFADGEKALAVGDPERARARAVHVRETWPGGPLEIDAAILQIRALRALGQDDAARRVLAAAEQLGQAQEKAAVLAELRTELSPPPFSSQPAVDEDDAVDVDDTDEDTADDREEHEALPQEPR